MAEPTRLEAERPGRPVARRGPSGIPLPRQHGAWMMLYKPLLATLVGAGISTVSETFALDAVLLVLVATGGFFAQNAAGIVLRGRATRSTKGWLILFAGVTALSGAWLIGPAAHRDLLWLAAPALALFIRNARFTETTRRGVDRSVIGEFMSIGGLVLTAPAAYVVAAGRLDPTAGFFWLCWTATYGGSVYYVKMLVSSGQVKEEWSASVRWRQSRKVVVYHLALTLYLATAILWLGAEGALLLGIGATPLLARAATGVLTLSPGLPNLRQVGFSEMAYSTWFAICFAWAVSFTV